MKIEQGCFVLSDTELAYISLPHGIEHPVRLKHANLLAELAMAENAKALARPPSNIKYYTVMGSKAADTTLQLMKDLAPYVEGESLAEEIYDEFDNPESGLSL